MKIKKNNKIKKNKSILKEIDKLLEIEDYLEFISQPIDYYMFNKNSLKGERIA